MESEHAVNVFKTYKQEENNFTNGLCSLLRLSVHEKPRFISSFMKELLDLTIHGALDSRVRVRVLRGIQLADAELCGGSCCIRFETKVASGTLRHEQVRRHLRELDRRPGRLKRVVLLTPDDGESSYIKEFLSRYRLRRAPPKHGQWSKSPGRLSTAALCNLAPACTPSQLR